MLARILLYDGSRSLKKTNFNYTLNSWEIRNFDFFIASQEWENADIAAMFPYFLVLTSLALNVFVFCQIGEILTAQVRLFMFFDWKPTKDIFFVLSFVCP